MKGIISWHKLTAMFIAAVMSVALIQTPLLAETTDGNDTSEAQDSGESEEQEYTITSAHGDEHILGVTDYTAHPNNIASSKAKAGDKVYIYIQLLAGSTFNGVDVNGQRITDYQTIDPDDMPVWSASRNKGDALRVEFTMPAEDVIYEIDVTSVQFSITVEETEHGKIELDKYTAAPYYEDVKIYVTPDEGYELESLIVGAVEPNGNPYYGDFINEYGFSADTTEFETTIPFADTTVSAKFKKIDETTTDSDEESTNDSEEGTDGVANTYGVVIGADGTCDGSSDYVVEVKSDNDDEHSLDRFVKATMDDHEMKIGEEIELSRGSTIVTIKSDYLKTLSEGTHTITVYFTDNQISTTLTIKGAGSTSNSGSSSSSGTTNAAEMPATGEMQSPAMYIGIAMIVAAAGAVSVALVRKHREEA